MGIYLINGKYDNKNYNKKIDWVIELQSNSILPNLKLLYQEKRSFSRYKKIIEKFSNFVLNDDNIIKAINEAKKDNKYLKDLSLEQAKKYLLLEDDVNSYDKLLDIFKNLIFVSGENIDN